ncbi:MAG: sugar phosphate isomerase/epimerase [Phycisphaeraceae bacterium]|nr:sugar phosphate isomerase/epimerase [Phycisphaeraceae bacterium]
MLKPAFSTVACPAQPLREIARLAEEWGYEGVELRTFGDDSRQFACDPALSDPAKVLRTFSERGIEILSLATSLSFDARFSGPPVIGRALFDQDRSIREGRRAIDLANALGCPIVRVFGFRIPARESRVSALARITDRLKQVLDQADRTGVRLALENGGSFGKVSEVVELLDACDSPLLGVCYSNAAAMLAGEDPVAGVKALGDRIISARVRDAINGVPCLLGEGDLKARAFGEALMERGLSIPLIFEHDAAWRSDALPGQSVLPAAARAMFGWMAGAGGGKGVRTVAGAAVAGHR